MLNLLNPDFAFAHDGLLAVPEDVLAVFCGCARRLNSRSASSLPNTNVKISRSPLFPSSIEQLGT